MFMCLYKYMFGKHAKTIGDTGSTKITSLIRYDIWPDSRLIILITNKNIK